MSYDLFFHTRDKSSIDGSAFVEYFKNRPHYKIENSQAWYANEDTGVYFSFDWGDGDEEYDSGEEDMEPPVASFNLNYYRPHVFALEAEPEVQAFVEQFNFLIGDPQMDGMGTGEYSSEGFLRGWNAGNKFAAAAMQQSDAESEFQLPAARIQTCWRWNKQRNDLQGQLGPDIFVPAIMFARRDGGAKSFITWGDAISIVVPQVDLILLVRQQLPKKSLFSFGKPEFAMALYDSVLPILEGFPQECGNQPYHTLQYDTPPPNILKLFKEQPTVKEKFGISFDQIVDAELKQHP